MRHNPICTIDFEKTVFVFTPILFIDNLCQWAVTTSVDYSLAILLQVIILLSTGGLNGGGHLINKYEVLAIHGCLLFLHALLNNLPIIWLAHLGTIAAVWNIIGNSEIIELYSVGNIWCFNCI